MPNKGGITFNCRSCDAPGFQPFVGTSAISFWMQVREEQYVSECKGLRGMH
jgi:hypothetical protein